MLSILGQYSLVNSVPPLWMLSTLGQYCPPIGQYSLVNSVHSKWMLFPQNCHHVNEILALTSYGSTAKPSIYRAFLMQKTKTFSIITVERTHRYCAECIIHAMKLTINVANEITCHQGERRERMLHCVLTGFHLFALCCAFPSLLPIHLICTPSCPCIHRSSLLPVQTPPPTLSDAYTWTLDRRAVLR